MLLFSFFHIQASKVFFETQAPKSNSKDYLQKFNQKLTPQFEKKAWKLVFNQHAEKKQIWVAVAQDDAIPGEEVIPKVNELFKDKFKELFKHTYAEIFGAQPVPAGFENISSIDENKRLEELSTLKGHNFYQKTRLVGEILEYVSNLYKKIEKKFCQGLYNE